MRPCEMDLDLPAWVSSTHYNLASKTPCYNGYLDTLSYAVFMQSIVAMQN